jgi:hypothetical protein
LAWYLGLRRPWKEPFPRREFETSTTEPFSALKSESFFLFLYLTFIEIAKNLNIRNTNMSLHLVLFFTNVQKSMITAQSVSGHVTPHFTVERNVTAGMPVASSQLLHMLIWWSDNGGMKHV